MVKYVSLLEKNIAKNFNNQIESIISIFVAYNIVIHENRYTDNLPFSLQFSFEDICTLKISEEFVFKFQNYVFNS